MVYKIVKIAAPRLSISLQIYFCLFAIFIAGVAVYQAALAYNPVPIWDMQEGYLGFLNKIHEGHWAAWIEPHNEHRIFLQRLIFWLDNYVFGGLSIFAIACNFICISVNVVLLYLLAKRDTASVLVLPLLVSWCFLLLQGANITWAFQAQFHLAYLVPLIGFYLLSVERSRLNYLRCLGVVGVGLLSIGTMGNGVLALPLYVACAIVMRFPLRYFGVLLGGLALEFVFLLATYKVGSSPLNLESLSHVGTLLIFLLRLLGSPFYYLTGESDRFFQVEVMGALYLLLLSTKFAQLLFTRQAVTPKDWVLVAFAGYVTLSYAGASFSRSFAGIELAVTTHYTTPSLLGWAALALVYSDDIGQRINAAWRAVVLLIFSFVVGAYQYGALSDFANPIFDWKVSALGVAMGVDDQIAQRTLTSPDFFHQIRQFSEPAYQLRLGYFQSAPLSGIRDQIGQVPARNIKTPLQSCSLAPFQIMTTTDPKFVRLSSVLEVSANGSALPDFVRILNGEGRQLGFALVQSGWRDLRDIAPVDGKYRFRVEGYVSSQVEENISVEADAGDQQICNASAVVPSQPFELKQALINETSPTVSIAQVLNLADIRGGDGLQTNLCQLGLQILGTSGAKGDADTGEIRLRLKKGQGFLYRSGPTAGNQRLNIVGGPQILLPQVAEWAEVSLGASVYGDKDFLEVSISDTGSGWGEWSATMVRTSMDQCRSSLR